MKCFLACFGLSKTQRKHRKLPKRVSYANQIEGNYEPLESDVKLNLKSNGKESEFSHNKENLIPSIGVNKKVSFNLNVKSYEPLAHVEYTSCSSESEEKNSENIEEVDTVKSSNESVLENLGTETFTSNYRYWNWQESDDDIVLNDMDDYRSQDADEETRDEDPNGSSDGENENSMPVVASLDQELKKLGFDFKAKRQRSEYVFSVLNPVENLTQWRALKAKRPTISRRPRKENARLDFDYKEDTSLIKPLMLDMAVDTSLSNWLTSSK